MSDGSEGDVHEMLIAPSAPTALNSVGSGGASESVSIATDSEYSKSPFTGTSSTSSHVVADSLRGIHPPIDRSDAFGVMNRWRGISTCVNPAAAIVEIDDVVVIFVQSISRCAVMSVLQPVPTHTSTGIAGSLSGVV